MTEAADTEYVGAVEKIVAGHHGPYGVARIKGIGAVTFSLGSPVWCEPGHPERGMYVVLSQVRKMRAGWRAMKGRFMRPSDQEEATPTANTATNSKEQGR
jgi:hypothetical protein